MTDKVLATVEVASAWASKVNWAAAVGGVAALITVLSGGKMGIDSETQKNIVGAIALITSTLTIILRTRYTTTVTPSSVSSTPPNVLPIVVKVLLVTFALSFLVPSNTFAAEKKFTPTGDLVKDIKDSTASQPQLLTGNAEKDAHALWDKIVAASDKDLTYASALAGVAGTPASAVRKQCYDAILKLNLQVNGMNLKDANGNPLPQPDPKLFTGVEQAAETIDNLSPSGPLFTACAGMAQLVKTNVLTLINAIVTGAAGFAAMPVIPGL